MCANCIHGIPKPTHNRGNVLDLILCSNSLDVLGCDVDSSGVASSDHFPVLAQVAWKSCVVPKPLTWKPFKNISQESFDSCMELPLSLLHSWLTQQLSMCKNQADMEILQDDVVVAFGVLVLGIQFQINSPFGRFGRQVQPRGHCSWWSRDCRFALVAARQSRGTPSFLKKRQELRRVIKKAKRDHWKKFVATCERTYGTTISLDPGMYKMIRSIIHPKSRTTVLVRVGGELLPTNLGLRVWVRFLQRQVSWDGPCTPADALKEEKQPDEGQESPPVLQFDDVAAAQSARHVRQWERCQLTMSLEDFLPGLFSFSELCDAQASMNADAVTSPYDPLPMMAVLMTSEVGRSCLLGMLNLVYVTANLPSLWAMVPVLPIRKPGKLNGDIGGHRPISLMAALFKLYDKLLHQRIWPAIAAAVTPWQGGGIMGADVMVWVVNEIFNFRRACQSQNSTLAVFVDGQSAFCRPPASVVIEALIGIPGVGDLNIRAIYAAIRKLEGSALLGGQLVGHWCCETGLPQGGSLSSALFVALLVQLHDALANADCGIDLEHPDGTLLRIVLLAYIDDLLLLADSVPKLEKCLSIVQKWADKLRMFLNVAVDKTAVMQITGHLSRPLRVSVFNQLIPVVEHYRYLGVILSSNGSWAPWIDHFRSKCKARTLELVRWARANNISCDILARLWLLYVERGVAWGLAVAQLSDAQSKQLDIIQRVAGRWILGHSRVSPVPSVCLELGWQLLSSRMGQMQLSLLGRLRQSDHSIVAALLDIGRCRNGSWVFQIESWASSFALQSLPSDETGWRSLQKAWNGSSAICDVQELWSLCQAHPQLALFAPMAAFGVGRPSINHSLHDVSISAQQSRAVSKLLCGGQFLRAGDPVFPPTVSCRNVCIPCLHSGVKVPETLTHFLFDCPLYGAARADVSDKLSWTEAEGIVRLDSNVWSDQELKLIRGTMCRMIHKRQKFLLSMGLTRKNTTDWVISRFS